MRQPFRIGALFLCASLAAGCGVGQAVKDSTCLLYTSPSPRD